MFPFDPTFYGTACCQLLSDDRICALDAGQPDQIVRSQLEQLTDLLVANGRAIKDRSMAACCRSALWLKHDFLDESHRISQDINTPAGSYWHAIMHRREGDFSNAKYWFRQVGVHPIFDRLAHEASQLSPAELIPTELKMLAEGGRWDPYRFVDLCESSRVGRDLLRSIAHLEWKILFDYCYREAFIE